MATGLPKGQDGIVELDDHVAWDRLEVLQAILDLGQGDATVSDNALPVTLHGVELGQVHRYVLAHPLILTRWSPDVQLGFPGLVASQELDATEVDVVPLG